MAHRLIRHLLLTGGKHNMIRYQKKTLSHFGMLTSPTSLFKSLLFVGIKPFIIIPSSTIIVRNFSYKSVVITKEEDWTNLDKVYLHIGPSGDFWTGTSIFAAKHLQHDYVRSIELPNHINIDQLTEILDNLDNLIQQSIYDHSIIPHSILEKCYIITTDD